MPRNSIIGFLLGLVGLSKIVGFTTPWLMLIYPALVVIIVMSLFADFSKVKFCGSSRCHCGNSIQHWGFLS